MISAFRQTIQGAKSAPFFGGAGVSTESDIPDFRSAEGLYSRLSDRYVSPEEPGAEPLVLHQPSAEAPASSA